MAEQLEAKAGLNCGQVVALLAFGSWVRRRRSVRSGGGGLAVVVGGGGCWLGLCPPACREPPRRVGALGLSTKPLGD